MTRLFHPASQLPTPGIPLIMRLDTGEEVQGIRPKYIGSYSDDDKGYVDTKGKPILNVTEWAIK